MIVISDTVYMYAWRMDSRSSGVDNMEFDIADDQFDKIQKFLVGDKIAFVELYQDDFANNPLKEFDTYGKIYSRNNRHINFNPSKIQELLREQPHDVVVLSYFEHGRCMWGVEGTMDGMPDFRWDGSHCAGLWEPDADTLKEADNLHGKERRAFLEERAAQATKIYGLVQRGCVRVQGCYLPRYAQFEGRDRAEHPHVRRHGSDTG